MDGNGRWAQQRGLPRLMGHHEGANSIRECVEACQQAGVQYLTLYAFSLENWKRPRTEVKGLMGLLERFLRERTDEIAQKGICLRAIGRLQDLPEPCHKLLSEALRKTAENRGLTLILALSYGSRTEIVDAIKNIAEQAIDGKIQPDQINDQTVADHLYTKGVPDPDLLIRTSGEMRLSNFLLWQLSYTEIYVTQKLWPDFRAADLQRALQDYNTRHRRYGGI
ncbi:MAG: isoprenyl transferase [Verrucomicrobia bacterium]|nr:MAG: isoprenyl transferase [Verrucomicrobiota bacterium]